MDEFDYIIVGAGSSGCVLTERLNAEGTASVLLLEDGTDNQTEPVNMPRAFMRMWGNPKYFWKFPIKPPQGRPAGETSSYGRGLGGSSSTNGTWYMRGLPADHDAWHSSAWRKGHGRRLSAATARSRAIARPTAYPAGPAVITRICRFDIRAVTGGGRGPG